MRRMMSVAAFAAALMITAPVWAQSAEQLNQQELSGMAGGVPTVPATIPPAPAYAAAPAYPYPYPYPYPAPYYPYAYDPYAYYGAPVGVYIGSGWGWRGGGWHGGGGWHHH